MSHDVTANKYRPQDFDELIGQEFVASSLKNSINNKRIANAYLLSGPRGVGKTSAARIIAKALNCKDGPTGSPCNKCDSCTTITQGYNTDVIEIDGASNTSINDIRVIQEEILYPPVNSKYKVYIIDEVHMLSKSAFNALLKTIEEPPEYVVFIFATTEINKVLPTIRSRCQQFNFRLIPSDLIFNSLVKVLSIQKVKFEENALTWIANEGNGSMRDAYTLLDQIISFCDNEITLKKIEDKLGIIGEEKISKLVNGIIQNNREIIFSEYFSILESGTSHEQIIIELIEFFRNILIIKSNISHNKFIGFNPKFYPDTIVDSFSFDDIENIIEILFNTYENSKNSINYQIEIETCLIKISNYKYLIRPKQVMMELNKIKNFLMGSNAETSKSEKNIIKDPPVKINENNLKLNADKSEILKMIKTKISNKNFQLALALNNISFLEEKNNQMILFFSQKMHYDIAKANENLLTQEAINIIGEKYNKNFKIIVELKNNDKEPYTVNNKENIKQIFQGKEI